MNGLGLNLTGVFLTLAIFASAIGLERHYVRKIEATDSRQISVREIPMTLGDWVGTDVAGLTERESKVLQLDNYIRRTYRNSDGDEIFVYVGFWRKQTGEHQAAKHSPLMCLPANGWTVTSPQKINLNLTPEYNNVQLRRLTAQFGTNRAPELFYYWFFSGSETYTDESEALLMLIKHSLVEQRSDGGIIELSVNMFDQKSKSISEKVADQTLTAFAKEFYPALEKIAR